VEFYQQPQQLLKYQRFSSEIALEGLAQRLPQDPKCVSGRRMPINAGDASY